MGRAAVASKNIQVDCPRLREGDLQQMTSPVVKPIANPKHFICLVCGMEKRIGDFEMILQPRVADLVNIPGIRCVFQNLPVAVGQSECFPGIGRDEKG